MAAHHFTHDPGTWEGTNSDRFVSQYEEIKCRNNDQLDYKLEISIEIDFESE